jgi:hypothetical protein
LNCTLSGGGGTNSAQLASLDIQPTNTPGLLSGVVATAAPVSSDLTVSLSISTSNSSNGQAGIYSLPSPSVIIPSGRSSASFYIVWVSGDYNPSPVPTGSIVNTLIATAPTSSISRGLGNSMENFACMGTTSTVASDPLTISGTVLTPGMTGVPASASGVTIQAYQRSGTTPIVSTTSDASGSFSLSVPTGGVPFNGYLMISGAGFLNAAAFWSKPLTSATITTPFVLNSSEQAQLYQLGGTSAQVGASPVAFRVADCAGTPLGDAVVTINPVPIGIGGPFTAQGLGFNLGAPNFWALNEPTGSVTVSATDHGITFGQTTFTITGGQTVYVTITP